jgi:hypothetical protein
MKPDAEYLKRLLEAFEVAPRPYTDILQIKAAGLDYEADEFEFHMGLLDDRGFIEQEGHRHGFGLEHSADGSFAQWSVLPLRLTAAGHEFAEALRNKEVWATIKRDFKDASIDTLWQVSKKLLEGYTKKKLESVFGIET